MFVLNSGYLSILCNYDTVTMTLYVIRMALRKRLNVVIVYISNVQISNIYVIYDFANC